MRSWGRLGLRGKAVVGFVAMLALATALATTLERHLLLARLDERVRGELRQEVGELQRLVGGTGRDGACLAGVEPDGSCAVGRNPETGEPFGDDVEAVFDTFLRRSIPGEHETMLTFVDGRFHAGSIDQPPVELEDVPEFREAVATTRSPIEGTMDTVAGDVAFLAVPVVNGRDPPGVFVVAQFMAPQRALVLDGIRIVAAANVVLLLIATTLAAVALGRLLRPVQQLTETARTISESDLSRRIEVSGTDEVAELGRTFNGMLDRLEQAFASQREFLDDAAHELRTPITIVRGNLELLPDDPAERNGVLRVVTDELDRMSRFVDDLLLLAKAERPDFLRPAPVQLRVLIDEVGTRCAALAPRRWRVLTAARGTLVADQQRLTQAMLQLAQNAIQHTGPDDVIEVGGRVTGDEAHLWIADHGEGIPESMQPDVFQRFHRGNGTGTGLGLSIVEAIATAHGGSARLCSTPGEGATFTLVLPLQPPGAG